MDEEKLVKKCLQGKKRAQKQLFARYSGQMLTVCRRYTYDMQEAEDMLIIGFNRVFKYLQQFNNSGSLGGWIRRIMINVCLRNIENKKKVVQMDNEHCDYYMHDKSPDALDKLHEEELLKLISKMPKGYKLVFNMKIIDGYSHKEIAEKLDIKKTTSRTQLRKARLWLQNRLSTPHKSSA